MKSVALLAAVWIGLNALCVWLVANNKMQGWDLYAILFALVLGRVDGFDQNEAQSKRDERTVIPRCLFTA